MQHILTWNGITLRITYSPDVSAAFRECYGYTLAHLEVVSVTPGRAPLPITETGYRSHHTAAEIVTASGGLAAYVRQWLDATAKSPEWLSHQTTPLQLPLL